MGMYKYLNNSLIDSVLLNNTLRFTQPKFFNDPFEIQTHIKGIMSEQKVEEQYQENIEKILYEEYEKSKLPMAYKDFRQNINLLETLPLLKTITQSPTFINQIQDGFNQISSKYIGILSLSSINSSLLMWAHYANSHQGFVVEFDETNYFFNQQKHQNDFLRCLKKVVYSDKRPSLYLSDFNEYDIFFTKSIEWAYENEYRMLMDLDKADESQKDIYLFKFPKESIKSIYLGTRISDENKSKILDIIYNDEDFQKINIFQANISKEHYKLEFTNIKK